MVVKSGSPYERIYVQQRGSCKWCREAFSPAKLTKDHFLPKSKGHKMPIYVEDKCQKVANCVLACYKCNALKGCSNLVKFRQKVNKLPEDFPRKSVILCSITEAITVNEERIHLENLQKGLAHLEYSLAKYKERQEIKAIKASQTNADIKVNPFPQTQEKRAQEVCKCVLEDSRWSLKTLFRRIKDIGTKILTNLLKKI